MDKQENDKINTLKKLINTHFVLMKITHYIPNDFNIIDSAYDKAAKEVDLGSILFEESDLEIALKELKNEYRNEYRNIIFEEHWIKAEVPKDGTKVIRWNEVWKIPQCVFYKEGMSAEKSCVWITGDMSNSYPEESFLPNIYMPLIKKPDVI